jgi:hypothetical protein
MAAGVAARLGELWQHVDDRAAKARFDALLEIPAMQTLLGPRRVTNGVVDPQAYFQDMRRYTTAELAPSIKCPSFVTDTETDLVSTGQGQRIYDAMTCPKALRMFTRAAGPKDPAKRWRLSCSGPRRLTGSTRRCIDSARARAAAKYRCARTR